MDLIDGQIAALLVASFAADFILHSSVVEF